MDYSITGMKCFRLEVGKCLLLMLSLQQEYTRISFELMMTLLWHIYTG